MSNFNGGKRKRQFFAVIGLVLVAAMMLTTIISAFFV